MSTKSTQWNLSSFAILQNSKFLAAMYFLITIPFGLIFGLIGFLMPNDKSPFPGWIMIFIPFLYAILGFIFSVVGFALYNWLAGLMGGIQFDMEEI
jgi:hypothetical protein